MAKVTYSSTKGLVVDSGTGFQVNDAPVLEEIHDVEGANDGEATALSLENFGISSITTDSQVLTAELPNGDAAGQTALIVCSDATLGGSVQPQDEDTNNLVSAGDNLLDTIGDYTYCLWTGSAWVVIASEVS